MIQIILNILTFCKKIYCIFIFQNKYSKNSYCDTFEKGFRGINPHFSLKMMNNRIRKEIKKVIDDPPPCISVGVDKSNFRYLTVQMAGPSNTPYEGGIFKLELFLPDEYPIAPPRARFLTRIYHPNIDKFGRICLDTLKEGTWTPAMNISSVLISIQSLLSEPNPDDPLDNNIAAQWKNNVAQAWSNAREWTRRFADI